MRRFIMQRFVHSGVNDVKQSDLLRSSGGDLSMAGSSLSLSGDEVMPLDYRAGNTGWLLYGRKLDKARITQFQRKLGAAMVIVTAWAWTTIRWCGWRAR